MNKIDNYFQDFEHYLTPLPKTEKQNIVNELKDHFLSMINDEMQQGLAENVAIEKVIDEFPPPKEHAKQYISMHTEPLYDVQVDFGFRYMLALAIMGLAEMALLFVKDELHFILATIGFIMFIAGNSLIFRKSHWNRDNIKQLYWGIAASWILLAMTFFFFFRRNIVDLTSLCYLIFVTLLITIQFFILYRLRKTKNYNI